MLSQLHIVNFAIVDHLELDFRSGMTSITGETGAGKSIAIDALGLCLGNRAEVNFIRGGATKTEVTAYFDIQQIPLAQQWLINEDLLDADLSHAGEQPLECVLRRTINLDGRSRAYINGYSVSLTQLRALGALLIGIHGQHAHHAMLRAEQQLTLVDGFAHHPQLLADTKAAYQQVKLLQQELTRLEESKHQRLARQQLLQYQVEELDEFALQEGEFIEIEAEHKRLANSSFLLETCEHSLSLLSENDEHNIASLIYRAISVTEQLVEVDPALEHLPHMLNEALISVQEAASELQSYQSHLELDPQHFQNLEARLSQAMQLARKHQVAPEALVAYHIQLSEELASLHDDGDKTEQIDAELTKAKQAFVAQAQLLSDSRSQAAALLSEKVTAAIQQLNMPHGLFVIKVNFNPELMSIHGADHLEFTVTTNPGQPLQSMGKVASGGELSRIGLAIQVITAQKVAMPSLIFDEVDVGISGATASIVGKLLRQLGESTQVLCVTHLPQVAACGHQQMLVAKSSDGEQTRTTMRPLDDEARLQELARLIAGDTITSNALASAKELLQH